MRSSQQTKLRLDTSFAWLPEHDPYRNRAEHRCNGESRLAVVTRQDRAARPQQALTACMQRVTVSNRQCAVVETKRRQRQHAGDGVGGGAAKNDSSLIDVDSIATPNWHGWEDFDAWFKCMLAESLQEGHVVQTAAEIGSWFGRNTTALLRNLLMHCKHADSAAAAAAAAAAEATSKAAAETAAAAAAAAKQHPTRPRIFAVDHWLGSSEHQPGAYAYYDQLPYIYQQFLTNVKALVPNFIVPLRMTSAEAASVLRRSLRFDMVVIDGEHTSPNVKCDLESWWARLSSGGILCGDLWHWQNVRETVQQFADVRHLGILLYTKTGERLAQFASTDLWSAASSAVAASLKAGAQRWRLVNLDHMLPLPRAPLCPKRRACFMTMVREEQFYLPRWLAYYRQHADSLSDLFVIHHLPAGAVDDCMACLPAEVVRVVHDYPEWDSTRWNVLVQKHYQHLLQLYEVVVFTDVDEFLVARCAGGLRAYIDEFVKSSGEFNRRCTGIDMVQDIDGTEPLPYSEQNGTILQQRRCGQRVQLYDKPMMTRQPFRFAIGFHDIMPDHMNRKLETRVDPDLVLLHLHRFDWTFYEQRHCYRAQRFRFSQRELQANYCYHYRESDRDKLRRQFTEQCGPAMPLPDWIIALNCV